MPGTATTERREHRAPPVHLAGSRRNFRRALSAAGANGAVREVGMGWLPSRQAREVAIGWASPGPRPVTVLGRAGIRPPGEAPARD